MTVLPLCQSCAYHQRVVRRELALNEKRQQVGRAVNLDLIRKSKAFIASCSRCHPTTDSA